MSEGYKQQQDETALVIVHEVRLLLFIHVIHVIRVIHVIHV